MRNKPELDELDLNILGSIDKNIITDQRKLSSVIGASLGKVNYCFCVHFAMQGCCMKSPSTAPKAILTQTPMITPISTGKTTQS